MKLWIVDSNVADDDIEAACSVAEALIVKRGLTVEAAYRAVMNRFDGKPFVRNAAKAWDDAEEVALTELFGDIDDWPDGPVLAPDTERKPRA